MKKILILIAVTGVLMSAQCRKDCNRNDCMKVSLVTSLCADVILQIKDPAFYHLSQGSWTYNGVTYEHVFKVDNFCDYSRSMQDKFGNNTPQDFYVRVTESETENCAVCLALIVDPPSKRLAVKAADCNGSN
jgi:hypothetical protein